MHTITKQITNLREPISAEEKLAVTLRYLTTTESCTSLMYLYRVHSTTIAQFEQPFHEAIYILAPKYMRIPNNPDKRMELVKDNEEK